MSTDCDVRISVIQNGKFVEYLFYDVISTNPIHRIFLKAICTNWSRLSSLSNIAHKKHCSNFQTTLQDQETLLLQFVWCIFWLLTCLSLCLCPAEFHSKLALPQVKTVDCHIKTGKIFFSYQFLFDFDVTVRSIFRNMHQFVSLPMIFENLARRQIAQVSLVYSSHLVCMHSRPHLPAITIKG